MSAAFHNRVARDGTLRRGARRLSFLLLLGLPPLLGGCGAHVYHIVQQGDTLYSVSFRYQRDHHDVAEWNGLQPPYALKAGQQLRVAPPRAPSHGERMAAAMTPGRQPAASSALPKSAVTAPAPATDGGAVTIPLEPSRSPPPAASSAPTPPASPRASSPAQPARPPSGAPPAVARATPPAAVSKPSVATAAPVWQWPVHRADVRIEPARKGVEIRAARGEPVYAAADGRVVYGGTGIPHFGNLLIIKHDERFLSAYAHNQRLLVTEGTQVRAGQQIAEMGDSGTGTQEVKLHFEIRLDGTPVDPMQYLPQRRGG